jgi:citrate lyase subunit beta/citryl-CoA lyase
MQQDFRPRRSVLYVPASNRKALAKLPELACDAAIFDLEDAVAPSEKDNAREALRDYFKASPTSPKERVIRINPLASEWGTEDLLAACACRPDAILISKVNTPRDIQDVDEALDDADADLKIWAMIETPKAILNLGPIAELARDHGARLACFVAGTNDLAKEIGLKPTPDRRYLSPIWRGSSSLLVLAASMCWTALATIFATSQPSRPNAPRHRILASTARR